MYWGLIPSVVAFFSSYVFSRLFLVYRRLEGSDHPFHSGCPGSLQKWRQPYQSLRLQSIRRQHGRLHHRQRRRDLQSGVHAVRGRWDLLFHVLMCVLGGRRPGGERICWTADVFELKVLQSANWMDLTTEFINSCFIDVFPQQHIMLKWSALWLSSSFCFPTATVKGKRPERHLWLQQLKCCRMISSCLGLSMW